MKYVEAGEPHAGCRCPSEFEGRHCQYRRGTAPEYELRFTHSTGGVEGVFLFFIILIVGLVVGGFGYIVYRKVRARAQVMTDIEHQPKDLQLGETIEETKPQGEMA